MRRAEYAADVKLMTAEERKGVACKLGQKFAQEHESEAPHLMKATTSIEPGNAAR